MEDKRIDVYHTHIEVYPYSKGEFFELEKTLSRWDQISKTYGQYRPIAYYIENGVLYIPKGINIEVLESKFGCKATINLKATKAMKMSSEYQVKIDPRSEVQRKSISFLTGTDEYHSRSGYCQYCLNLETSGGKTYCAISAMAKLGVKTLIFVNREILVHHWKKEIMKFTDIPDEKIMLIDTESISRILEYELDADVYIVMHQTVQAFAKNNSWNDIKEFMSIAGIGIKIYDEAHEFMSSIFTIDCNTNVAKTFYLTATLGRSNRQENKCLNIMLSASAKFNDSDEVKRKHIHYHPIIFQSAIPLKLIALMKTGHGFSSYKYVVAALKYDIKHQYLNAIKYCIEESAGREGQILIVTPMKDAVRAIEEYVESLACARHASVGTIFSDNPEEVNLDNQHCDIIISTIKSCGTGFNPPNLQTIICGEPHTSRIMTHQLKGRLDRFKGDATYFYDLIDKSIPFMDNVESAHQKELEPMCAEVAPIYI